MLKLSGQILEGNQESGIDTDTLKKLCEEIKSIHEKHNTEIVIVIGGGNFWRFRDFQDSGIQRVNSDYMGMLATIMNGVAISDALNNIDAKAKVYSSIEIPNIATKFDRTNAINDLKNDTIIVCSGGTGNPFFTTDSAAALRALELECDILLKGTKVNGVFDSDPEKNPDAKHIPEATFDEVLTKELAVMDFAAVSLCRDNSLPIVVFDIKEPGNLEKAILGETIGTKVY